MLNDDVIYFDNDGNAIDNSNNNTIVRNANVKLKLFGHCEKDDSLTVKDVSSLRAEIFVNDRHCFSHNVVCALSMYIFKMYGNVEYTNVKGEFLGKVGKRETYYLLCESAEFIDRFGDVVKVKILG